MSKACEIINGPLSRMLSEKELIPIKKVDDLLKIFKDREEEDGVTKIGTNILNSVSHALYYGVTKALNQQMPFEAMFKNTTFKDYRYGHETVPKLMFTVLNGGKELNSKIKFSKFYLIFSFDHEDLPEVDIEQTYFKIQASIEKGVTSTKGGLAAFKRNPTDGSFFNAYDNINECFKLLEDAINATGVNTDAKKYLKIGINTDAQSWYVEDTKKYEWDGPKNPLDSDQLMDFYDKLVTDHPLLEYFEDCFA